MSNYRLSSACSNLNEMSMKVEVACACEFLARILMTRHVPFQFIRPFSQRLEELLTLRFKDHWFPENPGKGSAYRCIRINGRMDPLITEAAKVTGLTNIGSFLPKEFTMWIDPSEVSYRFGEEGSICQCPLATDDSDEEFPFSDAISKWTNTSTTTTSATSESNRYSLTDSYHSIMSTTIPVQVWETAGQGLLLTSNPCLLFLISLSSINITWNDYGPIIFYFTPLVRNFRSHTISCPTHQLSFFCFIFAAHWSILIEISPFFFLFNLSLWLSLSLVAAPLVAFSLFLTQSCIITSLIHPFIQNDLMC